MTLAYAALAQANTVESGETRLVAASLADLDAATSAEVGLPG